MVPARCGSDLLMRTAPGCVSDQQRSARHGRLARAPNFCLHNPFGRFGQRAKFREPSWSVSKASLTSGPLHVDKTRFVSPVGSPSSQSRNTVRGAAFCCRKPQQYSLQQHQAPAVADSTARQVAAASFGRLYAWHSLRARISRSDGATPRSARANNAQQCPDGHGGHGHGFRAEAARQGAAGLQG